MIPLPTAQARLHFRHRKAGKSGIMPALCNNTRLDYLLIMAIQRRAIALISGGLDSMLAVRVIQEQGILVEGVNFFTGFCVEGHTHAIRKKDQQKQKRNNALWVAEQLGIAAVVDEQRRA